MIQTVGLGVIGVGVIGATHCDAICRIPNARLVAVAHRREERAREIAMKYSTKAFIDYEEMLSLPQLDAVVVCTPDHMHVKPCLDAARAGKHILVEKPIATALPDANAIIQAAREARVKLQVGHHLRYDPKYIRAKEHVDAGDIGALNSIFARRVGGLSVAQRVNARTSLFLFLGVHDYDVMRWISGAEAATVYAQQRSNKLLEIGALDMAHTLVTFTDGVIGSVELGWVLPQTFPAKHDFRLDIFGTDGAVQLDTNQGVLLCTSQRFDLPYRADLLDADSDFVRCIIEDRAPRVSGEDGREAMRIALAAMKSVEDLSPVHLLGSPSEVVA